MAVAFRPKNQARCFEFFCDFLVGILKKDAGVRRTGDEPSVQADCMYDRQIVFESHLQVIGAVGRCNMHNAGAGVHGHEVGADNIKAVLFREEFLRGVIE